MVAKGVRLYLPFNLDMYDGTCDKNDFLSSKKQFKNF